MASLLLGACHSSISQKDRPNILVIVADDMGYGDLGCFGAEDIQSPHIDQLAEEGVRFTNFHTTSSVCSPSRASMLTGKAPDKVGVPGVIRYNKSDSFGYFDPDAVTVADVLKNAGYQTALIGKWHLGEESPNLPNDRGFDHYKGWLVGMTDYYKHERYGKNWMRENKMPIVPKGHVTDLFTDWTIDYINQSSDEPFCLFLHYTAPHSPLQPPQEYYEKVKAREKGIGDKRAKYVALVEHMDDGIAKVIQSLKDNRKYENTLILFLSDNGGALHHGASNGDLAGMKGDLLEGGVRVPFIANWPGVIKRGQVSNKLLSITDLMPTLSELAQTDISHIKGLDGHSLTPVLNGKDAFPEERSIVYVRRGNNKLCSIGNAFYAIQKGEWKLVQNAACEPFVFYNMKDDKEESKPVLPEELPKKYKKFEKALKKHIVQTSNTPWQKGD
ncbi:MAG: sulfatase-like hydrolase/transferase [Bacteroidales bacterium]|nr:sulfatase-like hydrolase/transferase [Bacteroidales bacterium]